MYIYFKKTEDRGVQNVGAQSLFCSYPSALWENDVGRRALPTSTESSASVEGVVQGYHGNMAAAAVVRVCCDHLEAFPFSVTSILRPGEKR